MISLQKTTRYWVILSVATVLFSCKATRIYRSDIKTRQDYHSPYDDTTLSPANGSLILPYNRFIDPAGTTVGFGNTAWENHSLDLAVLPNEKTLAVEDRYGLAFIDATQKQLLFHLDYTGTYKGLMSAYSGIKTWQEADGTHILWTAAGGSGRASYVLEAVWNGKKASITDGYPFTAKAPAPIALPNDIAISNEQGARYLYVVLNGNNQLIKIRWKDKKQVWATATGMAPYGVALADGKVYVTNWAGPVVAGTDTTVETAGIPYSKIYVDPRTGASQKGTVTVIDCTTGQPQKEIVVGLHPNAIISSHDQQYVYVCNGNSDDISVIHTPEEAVTATIPVRLHPHAGDLVGDSPNALAIDRPDGWLYVANGMDNAVAVIRLGATAATRGTGATTLDGFIPTGAYPGGLALTDNMLYVANLEGEGAQAPSDEGTFNSHHQLATVSLIPLPDAATLAGYTQRVNKANLVFRTALSTRLPRRNVAPKPVPERIGEPSVFKHVIYIIKENRTYDQVLGDMPEGDGLSSICTYGEAVTPNQHRLARDFLLLDNYYVSGKSSAEGHSWSDAAIVTDYIEKNVRAWFRSYPHILNDAMAYNKNGFLWNHALDHGKTVRIYGEACSIELSRDLDWQALYRLYQDKKSFHFTNTTTIGRVAPILSNTYPCYVHKVNDQWRADAFIKEMQAAAQQPGDAWPALMILALPSDHTSGTAQGYPTPRAMVADNDLALGRIIDAVSHSRFWDSTVIFVTEDDSQAGWDHVSAYRTTGFVVSPYSRLHKTVHTNYNQTGMVRTIEQILGLPPMNIMDATALPMFDCFTNKPVHSAFTFLPNQIPLDEMNKTAAQLSGKAKKYALLSASPQYQQLDAGDDDLLNHILWFAAKGNIPYPKKMTLPKGERDEDD